MPIDDPLHDYAPEEAESDEEYQERMDEAASAADDWIDNQRDLALEDGHD